MTTAISSNYVMNPRDNVDCVMAKIVRESLNELLAPTALMIGLAVTFTYFDVHIVASITVWIRAY